MGNGKREKGKEASNFLVFFDLLHDIWDDAGNPKDWFDEFSLSHKMGRARCLEATVVKLSKCHSSTVLEALPYNT